MKKIFCVMSILLFLFSLTACTAGQQTNTMPSSFQKNNTLASDTDTSGITESDPSQKEVASTNQPDSAQYIEDELKNIKISIPNDWLKDPKNTTQLLYAKDSMYLKIRVSVVEYYLTKYESDEAAFDAFIDEYLDYNYPRLTKEDTIESKETITFSNSAQTGVEYFLKTDDKYDSPNICFAMFTYKNDMYAITFSQYSGLDESMKALYEEMVYRKLEFLEDASSVQDEITQNLIATYNSLKETHGFSYTFGSSSEAYSLIDESSAGNDTYNCYKTPIVDGNGNISWFYTFATKDNTMVHQYCIDIGIGYDTGASDDLFLASLLITYPERTFEEAKQMMVEKLMSEDDSMPEMVTGQDYSFRYRKTGDKISTLCIKHNSLTYGFPSPPENKDEYADGTFDYMVTRFAVGEKAKVEAKVNGILMKFTDINKQEFVHLSGIITESKKPAVLLVPYQSMFEDFNSNDQYIFYGTIKEPERGVIVGISYEFAVLEVESYEKISE